MTLWFLYIIILALERNVKHCRLRLAISNLNYDLFRRHLLEDAVCLCGYTAETSEHFYYIVPFIIVLEIKSLVN